MSNCALVWLVILVIRCCLPLTAAADHWPQFRGKHGEGVSTASPPVEFSTDPEQNIGWKVRVPGLGHASPIVWGDRIYVATAVPEREDAITLETGWSGGSGEEAEEMGEWAWRLICLDLASGETVWSQTACEGVPQTKRHIKATHANCTPATDGRHVVAFFGSEGLYCYDVDGKLLWHVDLGKLHSGPYNAPELEWGFSSSPVIHDGVVIVQCDCLNKAFVAVFDLVNGEEVLRIEREDVATWSTPGVFETNGRVQIVCNGYKEMAGYDLETGRRLWHLSGGGDVPVPTPLSAGGLFLIANGHGRSPIYAISHSATGDLTPEEDEEAAEEEADEDGTVAAQEEAGEDAQGDDNPDDGNPGLVWWHEKGGTYMTTPIVYQERIFVCDDRGRLKVGDLATGERLTAKRIGKGDATFSASPVIADGRIYWVNEAGRVFVISTEADYEILAENDLKEICMATPAVAQDSLIVRAKDHLYRIVRGD